MTREAFAPKIYTVRDEPVVLDSDLALLYGVETRVFNQAIRRNRHRFPADFAFQLSKEEWSLLRSQIVTLKGRRGQHRKYLPWGFTEHGAIMAATILKWLTVAPLNRMAECRRRIPMPMRADPKRRSTAAVHNASAKSVLAKTATF